MKSDMLTKSEATLKAHAAITSAHPEVRDWKGLSAVLDELWETSAQRAAFDHQMAVMAYHFAQAIDARGPQLVAERIGITVEELVERLKPERFAELTMSELLLLSISAEVSHDVIVRKKPDEADA